MGKAQKLKQQRKEEEEKRRREEKKETQRKLVIVAVCIATVAVTVGLIFLVNYMKKNEEDKPPQATEATQEETEARALDDSVPSVPDEIGMPNVTGAVAMAKPSDPQTQQPIPDSGSNEFYILKSDAAWLDGDFTVFGQVVEGMDVVNSLTVEDSLDFSEVREAEDEDGAASEWVLNTSKGAVVIRLFVAEAPLTTQHIIDLTNRGFYSGLKWYRVEDWVVQTGSHYRSLLLSLGGAAPAGGQ